MTARILAIDPGPAESAWLLLVDGRPSQFGKDPNRRLLLMLRADDLTPDQVAIEEIESFGMAVGREVFDTVRWAGRFEEAVDLAHVPVALIPRRKVKLHLCGTSRAKDPNVRQALIDRFGGSAAIGRKAAPGQLYGITADVWSALAIAVTFADGAA